jgi:tetratricopeptide (TPR) repeat protein
MSLRISIIAMAITAALQFAVTNDLQAKEPRRNAPTVAAEPTESAADLLTRGYDSFQAGELEDAVDALTSVINLPTATEAEIVEARYGLAVMYRDAGQAQTAIDQLNSLLLANGVNSEFEVAARVLRGRLLMSVGSATAADDFTSVIENPNAPVDFVEDALVWRAILRGAFSDWHGVLLDTDRLLIGRSSRPEVNAAAIAMRGLADKALGNNTDAAIELMAAYRMLDLPSDMVEPVANALREMGIDPNAPLHRT